MDIIDESQHYSERKLHVAVIGAGPSGLSSSRHLKANSDRFSFVCYEQLDDIGGIWLHSAATTKNIQRVDEQKPFIVHRTLRANSLTSYMEFPDFPFSTKHITSQKFANDEDSQWHFPMHYDVLKYLQDYARHFQLLQHIRLNEQVELVECTDNNRRFVVRTYNTQTSKQSQDVFDAVFICNGHNAMPRWPIIANIENFKGRYLHCKSYHSSDDFFSKDGNGPNKIVIFGCCVTGPDIALDLATRAVQEGVKLTLIICAGRNPGLLERKQILYQSHNILIRPDIVRVVGSHSVEFADLSTEHDVDIIIAATGFDYQFPFLGQNLALANDHHRLTPLYKHLVHINFPKSLFFFGLYSVAPGFCILDVQVRYVIALLKGQFALPSREAMLAWEANDFNQLRRDEMRWPSQYAHRMYKLSNKVHEELVDEEARGCVEPLPPRMMQRFLTIVDDIIGQPECFRELPWKNMCQNVVTTNEVNSVDNKCCDEVY